MCIMAVDEGSGEARLGKAVKKEGGGARAGGAGRNTTASRKGEIAGQGFKAPRICQGDER
jgi:hypothetical protein